MEREPGPLDEPDSTGPVEPEHWFKRAVERNESITLSARQVDRIVASLGLCTTSIFALIEAVANEENHSFKHKMLYEAGRSIEEASTLIEALTSDFTK